MNSTPLAPTMSAQSTQATRAGLDQACIPQMDNDTCRRASAVAGRKAGFLYGPSLVGEAAPFPSGPLGNARNKADYDAWSVDHDNIDSCIQSDMQSIQKVIQANGGLKTWQDYEKVLYDGQLTKSNPRGPAPGMISNATQDLLFSMERLSEHPAAVRRVRLDEDLPFPLDDTTTGQIVGEGTTLESLRNKGRLFIVDHSYQKDYHVSTFVEHYPVACSAYFYLHPENGDFPPLAIRTNVDTDLTYTPLDKAEDWLLAKMFFNANDMFHAQMLHLVTSHNITEAVHQAALRTLSENHPVMIMLERFMVEAYSSRFVAEEFCFNPGGHWDQLMVFNQSSCRDFVTERWYREGRYQDGYLESDLRLRGLINEDGQHPFKSFPFYEDAKPIRDSYRTFFVTFVDSYYECDDVLAGDYELKNWFIEATMGAKTNGFPAASQICKTILIDVLTHFAFATSVSHHSMNGAAPICSGTLPFHIPAIYHPIPTEKGVTDLMPYLPDASTALHYLGFMASFNRPFYGSQGSTLDDAFTTDPMLDRFSAKTRNASVTFSNDMKALSQKIRAREFDSQGLSQGMPFIYRTLDPGYIPFFCAV